MNRKIVMVLVFLSQHAFLFSAMGMWPGDSAPLADSETMILVETSAGLMSVPESLYNNQNLSLVVLGGEYGFFPRAQVEAFRRRREAQSIEDGKINLEECREVQNFTLWAAFLLKNKRLEGTFFMKKIKKR